MGNRTDLVIRQARLDDAEAITRILNPIIESGAYTVLDTPLTPEAEREFIASFPPRGVFHVAERRPEGHIVGLQTIEPFAAYTHAFDHVAIMGTFVDLAERRQAIGIRLSEATFEAARHKGFEKIFTYVRADNLASLTFHLNLGFQIVGTAHRQARINGQYVDEIVIEKFL
ncbi:MAG: GNAT family N-acetyltransferase [Chloroflexi bacterium]|nr:GNAT family N-acetyltransferase [Chloroflexota bacterium]MBU1750264.1 GNAT family N-acetyltransferase [Chloroflexota bacterium]